MIYKIKIEKIVNGLIIKVGCATFVAIDIDFAMEELARYFKNPEVVEKEYIKKFGLNICRSEDGEGREIVSQGNSSPINL